MNRYLLCTLTEAALNKTVSLTCACSCMMEDLAVLNLLECALCMSLPRSCRACTRCVCKPSAARGFTPSSDVLSGVQSCCSRISAGAPDQPAAAETPREPPGAGSAGHTEGQIRQIYQLCSPGGPFKQLHSRSAQREAVHTGGKCFCCIGARIRICNAHT